MSKTIILFLLLFASATFAHFPNRVPSSNLAPLNATPSFENAELVSVAYDPLIMSYPDKDMSPYGPDVSPVYNLTKQALTHLNPGNPDNPLSNIIHQNDTVMLKPNLVGASAFAREGCTRTPVLRPLVDFAIQAGASKVIIAEGSATPYPDSRLLGPDYSNITGLVEALQTMYPDVAITYKDLNLDNFTWVDLGENSTFHGAYTPEQLYSVGNMRMDKDSYYYAQDFNGYDPKGYRPGLYAIANTVFEADVFINVPKMKVHWITGVTLSLKNLIGITVSSTGNTTHEEGIKDTPHWNNSAPHTGDVLTVQDSFANDVIWRVIADLNKIILYADENGVIQPTNQRGYLSVVDAIIGMEGPTVYNPPGIPRPTGAIIAGQNPVAVDAVCSRVMGFNHTVLNSLVNMEQISDHPIGKADPTAICVVGASLNSTTFVEAYVPHRDYEDPQIAPYQIRIQHFDPPEAELIETSPAIPGEGVETKVIASTENIDLVSTGWLRYSLDGGEFLIAKMVRSGDTIVGNLGLLEAGTNVSYDVCLQDYFFNTGWSDKMHTIVTITGDVDGNGRVDASDLAELSRAYGSKPGDSNWNPSCDLDMDALIDGSDLFNLSRNYGKTVPTQESPEPPSSPQIPVDREPPAIFILSPENKTYVENECPLTFTISEPATWIGYSLNGQANVTIIGNTTLFSLPEGSHSLVVFADDVGGNLGASEVVYFNVETTRPDAFPIEIIAVIGIMAAVGTVVFVYFVKFKQ